MAKKGKPAGPKAPAVSIAPKSVPMPKYSMESRIPKMPKGDASKKR